MINLLLDIIFILIIVGATINILRGIGYRGDKTSNMGVKGKTLMILPTKNPPKSIRELITQILKFTRDVDLYIVYQGRRPDIKLDEVPRDIKIEMLKGVEDSDYIGKIGNIVTILRKVDISSYRYMIIIDDDILLHPRWFKALTFLAEDKGFSTGYRIYLPSKNSVGPILTSLWNLYTVDTIYSIEDRIVWGGSACIKTEAVNKETLLKLWRKAVSDDVPLTYLARCKEGIGFNEDTLVPSLSIHTLKEALEFIVRQQRIVYVYNRGLWLKGVLIHLFLNILALIGLINILEVIFNGATTHSIVKIVGILALFLTYTLKNHVRLGRYRRIFGWEISQYINRLKIYNLLFTPLLLILQLYLLLASRGREIMWRGSRYTLPTMEELGYSECINTS